MKVSVCGGYLELDLSFEKWMHKKMGTVCPSALWHGTARIDVENSRELSASFDQAIALLKKEYGKKIGNKVVSYKRQNLGHLSYIINMDVKEFK
ncbi:MAG: hypothetical protein ACRDC4_14140, partial [Plesiomonas sp.]